jgi:heparan-sulfate lyase
MKQQGTGDVDLHFQFAPGKAVFDKENYSVRSDFGDGWNVMVKTVGQAGMTLNEEEGQVSFLYTKKEPRPAFSYRIQKNDPAKGVRYITVVAPYSGKLPEIEATIVGNPVIGSLKIELMIHANGMKRKIGYDLE